MKAEALLMEIARETGLANKIVQDLCTAASAFPDGLPVERVRLTSAALRTHLMNAASAATSLEELAKGVQLPKPGA
jgi:hypothetical protein